MRTLFNLSVRKDAWTPNVGGPFSLGQAAASPAPTASIADIFKAAITGAGSAATEYEKAQAAKAIADAEQAKAAAAASQAAGITAAARATAPTTVLGMPPLLAGALGLGVAGIIIALIATR